MITYTVGTVKHIPKQWKFPAGEVGVSTHYDAASKDKELVKVDGVHSAVERSPSNLLRTICKDGEWVKQTTLTKIREKLNKG